MSLMTLWKMFDTPLMILSKILTTASHAALQLPVKTPVMKSIIPLSTSRPVLITPAITSKATLTAVLAIVNAATNAAPSVFRTADKMPAAAVVLPVMRLKTATTFETSSPAFCEI